MRNQPKPKESPMISKQTDMKLSISKQRGQAILFILPIALVAFGWWTVYNLARDLEGNSIQTYQDAQLEVVRNAARAADVYITGELERRGEEDVSDVEQEVLNNFVKPIRIGTVGDAWIYSPDYVVFDESEDFPAEYIGKSMAEIFELQKDNGAFHYQDMTLDVSNAHEGIGWYVWDPAKARESAPWWEFITQDSGREIAAYTPVKVFPGTEQELEWVIGMSAMLPEIMRSNGAYTQINFAIIQMLFVTAVIAVMLVLLSRAEAQVQELRLQVQELRIEIDETKKAKQVSDIVDSDYFKELEARAQAMRARKEESEKS
jgi:hypothetical protein